MVRALPPLGPIGLTWVDVEFPPFGCCCCCCCSGTGNSQTLPERYRNVVSAKDIEEEEAALGGEEEAQPFLVIARGKEWEEGGMDDGIGIDTAVADTSAAYAIPPPMLQPSFRIGKSVEGKPRLRRFLCFFPPLRCFVVWFQAIAGSMRSATSRQPP